MASTIRSDETTSPVGSAVHRFEQAGLGKAPFRFVGYETKTYQACQGAPIQPGTCCDYCGTGISGVYWIRSSDGKNFKVGCDCVLKTGDAGLRRVINAKLAEQRLVARHAREGARIETAKVKLADEAVRAELAAKPHPRAAGNPDYFGKLTLLDWAEWMMANAGNKGRIEVARLLGV